MSGRSRSPSPKAGSKKKAVQWSSHGIQRRNSASPRPAGGRAPAAGVSLVGLLPAALVGLLQSEFTMTLLFAAAAQGITEVAIPDWNTNFRLSEGRTTNLDLKSLLLNIVGGLLMGIGTAVEECSGCVHLRRAASAFRSGFIGIFTSFAWLVEFTAVGEGNSPKDWLFWESALFVVATITAGTAVNFLGYHATKTLAGRSLQPDALSGSVLGRDGLVQLSLLLLAVVLGCLHIDDRPLADHLLCGILFATAAVVVGEHVGAFPHYERHSDVEWATLRCNILAFALLAYAHVNTAANTWLLAFFNPLMLGKFKGTFCGALSAFGSTVDDGSRLWRESKHGYAVANTYLNAGACIYFLHLLRYAREEATAEMAMTQITLTLAIVIPLSLLPTK